MNLADPEKSRFIPVVFLYMKRDNLFFISILLIKRQAPVVKVHIIRHLFVCFQTSVYTFGEFHKSRNNSTVIP